MVKNLLSNAGDVGLIPVQGAKIPYATGQLSLRATTVELACLESLLAANYRAHVLWSPCTTTREKTCTPQVERSPSR